MGSCLSRAGGFRARGCKRNARVTPSFEADLDRSTLACLPQDFTAVLGKPMPRRREKKKAPWSQEEDSELRRWVAARYGEGFVDSSIIEWSQAASEVFHNRSTKQIRERWVSRAETVRGGACGRGKRRTEAQGCGVSPLTTANTETTAPSSTSTDARA